MVRLHLQDECVCTYNDTSRSSFLSCEVTGANDNLNSSTTIICLGTMETDFCECSERTHGAGAE